MVVLKLPREIDAIDFSLFSPSLLLLRCREFGYFIQKCLQKDFWREVYMFTDGKRICILLTIALTKDVRRCKNVLPALWRP